jgi:chromate transporter
VAGLVTAGVSFILPAMLLVTGFAWAYKKYGSLPQVDSILYGVKPVIIAVILHALWGLGKKAVKGTATGAVGVLVLVLYFLGVNEILLLAGGGLLVMVIKNLKNFPGAGLFGSVFPLAGWGLTGLDSRVFNYPLLFFTFLKIGSVLYGSGYVLLAFLHGDLVERLGWMTDQQLIDAIAVGQVTPGPVFTTATFVGYFLGDLPGALLATIGIFLPSFILVGISNPIIPRIRESIWASAFLDGVNVSALGLMAAVTYQLGRAALVDPLTIVLAAAAIILTFGFRTNSAWLVIGSALFGFLRSLIL